MKYPLGTLTLPYTCTSHSCGCRMNGGVGKDLDLLPVGSSVEVYDEGMHIDTFRGATLNEALEAVHREYPGATFDPEGK